VDFYYANPDGYKYYSDLHKDDENYNMMIEELNRRLNPKDNIILMFTSAAFRGETLILNKKDTIKFDSAEKDCYGTLLRGVPKSSKKIIIETKGRKPAIIPIKKGYDYIDIGNGQNKDWGAKYYSFLWIGGCI
jgi:hypothetical protein